MRVYGCVDVWVHPMMDKRGRDVPVRRLDGLSRDGIIAINSRVPRLFILRMPNVSYAFSSNCKVKYHNKKTKTTFFLLLFLIKGY